MKFTKRLMSLLLAVVMVVTMLGSGLTSLASITVSSAPVTVSITVPELIYLTPGSTSFQYYIAGAANGVTPSATATSTGSISFTASKVASSINITMSSSTGDATAALSTTDATNSNSLVAQINGGSMSASGSIIWNFNYVIDGKAYTSYAKTYVYKPYLGQVGAQHGYKYKTSIGNEPVIVAYAFIAGIHSATGGAYNCYYTGTSGYAMSPLVPGWGSGNVPKGNDDGYIDDVYYPANSAGTGGVASHGRTRTSSKSVNAGSTATVGTINVDSSRYVSGTPLSNIPNLKSDLPIRHSALHRAR